MPAETSIEEIRRALGDRYAIDRELGRGGMGAVYLARDLKLDRLVALKVLPAEFAKDVALRERFLRETRMAASFSHPNIVPVHAVEERDGVLAFAMGFVEGESVADRVRRQGALDVRTIVRLLQDIGYALAYAHGRGVVHRDIKPDNIMLERATGRALLMDFGISRTIATQVETRGLTRVGEVVGTPEYMSPEQASGDLVDGRSDIYSLGLVALFVVAGQPVVTGDSTQKILVKQLTVLTPSAGTFRADLPAALSDAIDMCVRKSPGERFQTAEALVDGIDLARLTAPEIPLAIRLFAQEAGTLGLILLFLTIMSPFIIKSMAADGSLDAILPVILLLAAGIARSTQTLAAARRLALGGFSPAETQRGMQAVVDERESMRAFLRADGDTMQRRKRTLRMVALMMPLSALLMYLAIARRVEWAPHKYAVGLLGMVMVVSSIVLLGFSLVLLLRSPVRATVGERMFRTVWLGPLGRAFLRFAARDVKMTGTSQSRPVVPVRSSGVAIAVAPKASVAIPDAIVDRVTSLEARMSALERRT